MFVVGIDECFVVGCGRSLFKVVVYFNDWFGVVFVGDIVGVVCIVLLVGIWWRYVCFGYEIDIVVSKFR